MKRHQVLIMSRQGRPKLETNSKYECSNVDGFVNIHDTEILSPPRMKIGTLCQAKGAAVMRSNFL
jgi:hypothetical protein